MTSHFDLPEVFVLSVLSKKEEAAVRLEALGFMLLCLPPENPTP